MPARAHATRFALDACARPCFVLFSATLSLLRNDRRLELLHELLDDRSAHHTTVPSPPPERLCRILHLLHARVCVAACPTQASHPFISSTFTNLCLNDCTIQDEVLNGKIEPATVLTAQLIFAMLAALYRVWNIHTAWKKWVKFGLKRLRHFLTALGGSK